MRWINPNSSVEKYWDNYNIDEKILIEGTYGIARVRVGVEYTLKQYLIAQHSISTA